MQKVLLTQVTLLLNFSDKFSINKKEPCYGVFGSSLQHPSHSLEVKYFVFIFLAGKSSLADSSVHRGC